MQRSEEIRLHPAASEQQKISNWRTAGQRRNDNLTKRGHIERRRRWMRGLECGVQIRCCAEARGPENAEELPLSDCDTQTEI